MEAPFTNGNMNGNTLVRIKKGSIFQENKRPCFLRTMGERNGRDIRKAFYDQLAIKIAKWIS
jgi:hypothetical protein